MLSGSVKLWLVLGGVLGLGSSVVGAKWTIGILLSAFLVFALLLIFNQEKILYIPVVMGYKTVSDNPEGYRSPTEWGATYRDFLLTTRDGEKIHGWFIHRPAPIATVLFCHENAGNIGFRVNNLVAMSCKLNVDIVAFDYRGYGDSSGQPSEQGLITDTQTVFDFVVNELKAKNIFIYGRSLGGAVAIQFAAMLGSQKSNPNILSGIIVENTFTSISDMIGSVFPFLNFSLVKNFCLRLKWESRKWIEFIPCPVMLISGLKDELVPPAHMKNLKVLCDKFSVKSEMFTVEKGTHNDTWVVGGDKYWEAQKTFIVKHRK
jgi:pimeloyl-ACP methyl ester carboxylesterase